MAKTKFCLKLYVNDYLVTELKTDEERTARRLLMDILPLSWNSIAHSATMKREAMVGDAHTWPERKWKDDQGSNFHLVYKLIEVP